MAKSKGDTDRLLQRRGCAAKFQNAFRGIALGVRGESSFYVQITAALAVVALGWLLRMTRLEWGLLVLCITSVLVAEMFNSALETLAKAVDTRYNPQVGKSLDISSAAVLLSSAGAAIVGTMLFAYRLGIALGWWV